MKFLRRYDRKIRIPFRWGVAKRRFGVSVGEAANSDYRLLSWSAFEARCRTCDQDRGCTTKYTCTRRARAVDQSSYSTIPNYARFQHFQSDAGFGQSSHRGPSTWPLTPEAGANDRNLPGNQRQSPKLRPAAVRGKRRRTPTVARTRLMRRRRRERLLHRIKKKPASLNSLTQI